MLFELLAIGLISVLMLVGFIVLDSVTKRPRREQIRALLVAIVILYLSLVLFALLLDRMTDPEENGSANTTQLKGEVSA